MKRTDNIYAVRVAKYATMYVEADSTEEAFKLAKEKCDELSDSDFLDSENEVDTCDAYSTEAVEYMEDIWTKDGKMSYDDYVDQLNEQED